MKEKTEFTKQDLMEDYLKSIGKENDSSPTVFQESYIEYLEKRIIDIENLKIIEEINAEIRQVVNENKECCGCDCGC